jgi:hypothetical protein
VIAEALADVAAERKKIIRKLTRFDWQEWDKLDIEELRRIIRYMEDALDAKSAHG